MATDMTVPNTILQQLGGRKFLVMTGARDLTGEQYALGMRVTGRTERGHHPGRVRYVKITLDPNDLYTLEAFDFVKYTLVSRYTERGLYFDNLAAAFEEATSLRTSLERAS